MRPKPGRYITPEQPPESFDSVRLFFPHEQTWLAIFLGQWDALSYTSLYEQTTGVSAEYAAQVFSNLWSGLTERETVMFVGMIVPAARSTQPNDSWLPCDGTAYQIEQYPALYNAIGDTFGDDGAGTFRVPDMRGRVPIAAGQGSGLTNRSLAAVGGEETHQLTTGEMPAHTHAITYAVLSGGSQSGFQLVSNGIGSGTAASGSTGSNTAHNTMPPFIALTFFIFTGGA